MTIVDRDDHELGIGDKIAWVATSYGNAYLKIGKIISIDIKYLDTQDDYEFDPIRFRRVGTGKKYKRYDVTIRVDIRDPCSTSNPPRRYIARLPVHAEEHEGQECVCKIDRAEKI